MKTVVFAYHNIGCTGIRSLLENGFTISAVFTHKDNQNENIWFESVAELATANNIPVYAPENVNHPMWVDLIRKSEPDFLFSFYFRTVLSEEILIIPKKGALNLHGSLLPAYRGRCPVNWVLLNGEKETGVTLHHMTAKPDEGDIVAEKTIKISENDTALSLHEKSSEAAAVLLKDALPLLKNGTAPRFPQNHEKASCFGGRKPEDGEIDWNTPSAAVKNLVRALTRPYPGAYSFTGNRKVFFWDVELTEQNCTDAPGTIVNTSPLTISCSRNAVVVKAAQSESGLYISGKQLAEELRLVEGMSFGKSLDARIESDRKKKVLILGVNGFIGNALSERMINSGRYEVHGMDIHSHGIDRLMGHPDFRFHEGDIAIHREWIEYHVKKCDIIVPLVAIATPAEYTRNPIRVFELDFEENLRIVRYCVKYGKRIVFPSTSEVYGMCDDEVFDEDRSRMVLGPINKQRWIYSCSKQLLDRVIYAYGQMEGLKFTLFRPFNWIGPRLDSLSSARIGSSRAITQLILNLVEGTPIQLVDGGEQKRCFTDINDGIECLFRIIENKNNLCDSRIINIGNPDNEASIRHLAQILVEKFESHPLRHKFPPFAGMRETESRAFYGRGYEDVQHRKPCIENARQLLDWRPLIPLERSICETLDFFLKEHVKT